MTALLMLLLSCGALEMQTVPLDVPDADAFLVRAGRGQMGLVVREDRRVRLYTGGATPATADLPADATAFDVADADGDGAPELLAVAGVRVLRIPFSASGEVRTLFETGTVLAGTAGPPLHFPLVVMYDGRRAVAVPTERALELRRLNGEVAARIPVESGAASALFGPGLRAWTPYPPQAAGPGGLEMQVNLTREVHADLPPELRVRRPQPVEGRRVSPTQLATVGAEPPSEWPWFPLRPDGALATRVAYAPGPPALRETLIRLRVPGVGEQDDGRFDYTPERRYPGLPVLPHGAPPDFNGDWNADLLLWSAAPPAASLDALGVGLVDQTWPIRLAVHLYAPDRQRYEPRPDATLELRVPLLWLMLLENGAPLRHSVLRDLDGDGRTDAAWATDEQSFDVWLYGDDGFGDAPAIRQRTGEPILAIRPHTSPGGAGPANLLVRTGHALYWVHPA